MPDCHSRASVVRPDVLATNIRNEALVPVWSTIHYQTAFPRRASPESFGAEKNSQLQGHVEPRKSIRLTFHFRARNVVDTQIALID
jgi:hypothetical protein